MYGHGSSQCRVKTFCARCAGQHKTTDCKGSEIKCANCNGPHESTSDQCENKHAYIKLKQRTQQMSRRRTNNNNNNHFSNTNYNASFPNTLHQTYSTPTGTWHTARPSDSMNTYNYNNATDLFSIEEIKNLTFELINNLRSCKNKSDQFVVITNLACKFLS